MNIIAFDPTATREYFLKPDKDKEVPFLIGTLDAQLEAAIQDSVTKYAITQEGGSGQASISVNTNMQAIMRVRFGIKGFSNLKNAKGALIPFETEKVNVPGAGEYDALKKSCLNALKPFIAELAEEIKKDNILTGDQEKN